MNTPTPASPAKPKKPRLPDPRQERFYDLFKCFAHGVCSQFEFQRPDDLQPCYSAGAAELERCQQLVRRAWNLARFAAAMFEDDERTIEAFNKELDAAAKKEDDEREEHYRELGI